MVIPRRRCSIILLGRRLRRGDIPFTQVLRPRRTQILGEGVVGIFEPLLQGRRLLALERLHMHGHDGYCLRAHDLHSGMDQTNRASVNEAAFEATRDNELAER